MAGSQRRWAHKILRPVRHLCGIRADAPRAPQRSTQNSKPGERLKPRGRIEADRTLTAPRSLAANWRQSGLCDFFLRRSRDGMWRAGVLRKTRGPWIGRGFAARRKGSAAQLTLRSKAGNSPSPALMFGEWSVSGETASGPLSAFSCWLSNAYVPGMQSRSRTESTTHDRPRREWREDGHRSCLDLFPLKPGAHR